MKELVGPFTYKTWTITAANQAPYRIFRLVQTAKNSMPDIENHSFCVSGFEVYGTVIELKSDITVTDDAEDDPTQNENIWQASDVKEKGAIECIAQHARSRNVLKQNVMRQELAHYILLENTPTCTSLAYVLSFRRKQTCQSIGVLFWTMERSKSTLRFPPREGQIRSDHKKGTLFMVRR